MTMDFLEQIFRTECRKTKKGNGCFLIASINH